MGKPRPACFAGIALVVAAGSALLHRTSDAERRQGDLVSMLRDGTAQERQEASGEILKQRQVLVRRLLSIAKARKPEYRFHDERELAVTLLGELRAAEAADALISDVTFAPPKLVEGGFLLDKYPCVEALIKIGRPSVTSLLRRVDKQPNQDTLALHVLIIQSVEGDKDIGALRIRKALRGAVGGRKRYLEALLKLYEKTAFPG